MHEIKCPKCGEVFQVDESGYTELLSQVTTVVVWFLQSFDTRFNLVTDSSESIMAGIAGFISPVMKPLGLGDWRITTSLISGSLHSYL